MQPLLSCCLAIAFLMVGGWADAAGSALVSRPSSGAVALLFGVVIWIVAVRASRRGGRGD